MKMKRRRHQKFRAERARRLALAIRQIEQAFTLHARVIVAQLRIDLREDGGCFRHQLGFVFEWRLRVQTDRVAIQIEIPRANDVHAQPLPRPIVNARHAAGTTTASMAA